MLRAFHCSVRNVVIFRFIKQAQKESGRKESDCSFCDPFLRDKSVRVSLRKDLVGIAAVEIAAVVDRHGGAVRRILGHMVVLVEIPDRPAVGDYMPFELPGSSQKIGQQSPAPAGRFAVDAVVAAHDGLNPRLCHQAPECRQIGLCHILL